MEKVSEREITLFFILIQFNVYGRNQGKTKLFIGRKISGT
jgi:hypothetical protein